MGTDKSTSFPVTVGVKQGCVIAPVLFNLYIMSVTMLLQDSVDDNTKIQLRYRTDRSLFDLRKLQARTKCTTTSFLELQYADDCAFVTHTKEAMQSVLTVAARYYAAFGLTINTDKTEILFQPGDSNNNETRPSLLIDNCVLKVVPEFKYLGAFISNNCSLDYELNYRISQANMSYGRFRIRVFENHNICLKTKVRVYRAVCLSALLYGAEAWVLYRKQTNKLESFHIRSLQRMLGLTWRDKVTHSTILQRCDITSIEAMLVQRQLRWTGHVIRMEDCRLPKAVLYGELSEGQRNVGAPKKRFKDQLKKNLKTCNIVPDDLELLAHERSEWRLACRNGLDTFERTRNRTREERRLRRHREVFLNPDRVWTCDECGRVCGSRIGLDSHLSAHARQRNRERAVVIGHDGLP